MKNTILILSILLLISMSINTVFVHYSKRQNIYIKTTLKTYIVSTKEKTLRQQERFKNGFKYGVFSSNTALRHTKDLTNRDKAIYWYWMQKEADKLGIELK
jgi:hypothetical protein